MKLFSDRDRNTMLIRSVLKWLALLLILHIIGVILFSVIFAQPVATAVGDGRMSYARTISVIFTLLFWGICYLWEGREYAGDMTVRHRFQQAARAPGFDFLAYYLAELRYLIHRVIVFVIFLFPFTMFTYMWGYMHVNQHPIERFYVIDAGFYVIGGAFPGMILTLLYFVGFSALTRFVILTRWYREVREIHG